MMPLSPTAHRTLQDALEPQQITLQADFVRAVWEMTLNACLNWDAQAYIQAAHYERAHQRLTYRNGYRQRHWEAPVGRLALAIPKLRQGTYHPAWLRVAAQQLRGWEWDVFGTPPSAARLDALRRALGVLAAPPDELALLAEALAGLRERYLRARLRGVYTALWLATLPIPHERPLRLALAEHAAGRVELLALTQRSDESDALFLAVVQRRITLRAQSTSALPHNQLVPGAGGRLAAVTAEVADHETLLRYLTQVQTLQQNAIVIALGDALLPLDALRSAPRRILLAA